MMGTTSQRTRCQGDVVRRLPVLWRAGRGGWLCRTLHAYGDGVPPSERYTLDDGTPVTVDQIDDEAAAVRAAGRRT